MVVNKMNADRTVIDLRTRQPVETAPIAVDHGEHHSRMVRVLKNFLIDAETLGISLTTIRAWLVNTLAYVDAKIVMHQNRTKQ